MASHGALRGRRWACLTGLGVAMGLLGLGWIPRSPVRAEVAPMISPPPAAAAGTLLTDCVRCHPTTPLFSHPVGILPAHAPPAELPLPKGELDCITCHLPDPQRHAAAAQKHDPLLRLAVPTLCRSCHENPAKVDRTSHSALLGTAHLDRPRRLNTLAIGPDGLDPETRNCVSCHDGVAATDVCAPMKLPAGPLRPSHPFGVRYAPPMPGQRRSDMPLRPEFALDPVIRLFNHQVGCGSCHSPFSTLPKRLVKRNDRSALCLSCHEG